VIETSAYLTHARLEQEIAIATGAPAYSCSDYKARHRRARKIHTVNEKAFKAACKQMKQKLRPPNLED